MTFVRRLLGCLVLASAFLNCNGKPEDAGSYDVGRDALPGEPASNEPAPGVVQKPSVPTPPPTPAVREWIVSPRGNDSHAGSDSAPFRTIGRALTAVSPGEIIRVKAGVYAERVEIAGSVREGTETQKIFLQGEGKPKIVPSSMDGSLVTVEKPNWIISGFEVDAQNQRRYAVTFVGKTQGSTLKDSDIHHGSHGAGISVHGNSRGVVIENNHIHHFRRSGVDAHGVVVQPSAKDVIIRGNNIHDNTGDSVQCLGPEGFSSLPPADGVLIENNLMHHNFENAVDIKTCSRVTIRGNEMYAFTPTPRGGDSALVIHMSARDVLVEDNEIHDAAVGIAVGGNHVGPVPRNIVLQRNVIRDLTPRGGREAMGVRVENSESAKITNNTLTRIAGNALVIGFGTGGNSSNLALANNLVDVPDAVLMGRFAPGFKSDGNLFVPAARFVEDSAPLALQDWQSRGRDPHSVESASPVNADTYNPAPEAVDRGVNVGLPHCGTAPDIGAVETGCLAMN